MIIVTGAAGFIASCVAKHLLNLGHKDIVLVDDFTRSDKEGNLSALSSCSVIDRTDFFDWAADKSVSAIVHLGARTDTTEFDYAIFEKLNVAYSKQVWNLARQRSIPLIYASSAATYGGGEQGYADDHRIVEELVPLNPYGVSKNEFDKWVLAQEPIDHWYGLKFFNVYGPNEYHKGRMASVVWHAFNQISANGSMKLFRSHNPEFKDGEQLRDFVYVKDVCNVVSFLLEQLPESGLYNLGSGKARSFKDLTTAVFNSMDKTAQIEFVDTPEDIRDKYQYYTQAEMSKLKNAGYNKPFTSLENGVKDYVRSYLVDGNYF